MLLVLEELKQLETDKKTDQNKMENRVTLHVSQEEITNDIQHKTSADISTIRSGEAEFKEKLWKSKTNR